MESDTIVAQATPAGQGGVAIIRFSGKDSLAIALKLFKKETLEARKATFVNCYGNNGQLIDEGLALFFPAPHSFTGEDVLEFQCHGSPLVCNQVIEESLAFGTRLARPGEFSERAFLNDKLDLVQAEAIADLIESKTRKAAFNAAQSLKGIFSSKIHHIRDLMIDLRCFLEATIDFPDEEAVDFIKDSDTKKKLETLEYQLADLLANAEKGARIQEGMKIVLAGEPNVGKSSLLNALAQQERAIVTDIAGTTRDVLSEQLSLSGIPLTLIDTAGLRESDDPVEKEGIKRAWKEIEAADLILYLLDISTHELSADYLQRQKPWQTLGNKLDNSELYKKVFLVGNKLDKCQNPGAVRSSISVMGRDLPLNALSAKTGNGLNQLERVILEYAGVQQEEEGGFTARRRHLDALRRAQNHLESAKLQLNTLNTIELVAEDLRLSQQCLDEITGEFSADDLLGTIFSSFCIGK